MLQNITVGFERHINSLSVILSYKDGKQQPMINIMMSLDVL